jgi:hypothetical protein
MEDNKLNVLERLDHLDQMVAPVGGLERRVSELERKVEVIDVSLLGQKNRTDTLSGTVSLMAGHGERIEALDSWLTNLAQEVHTHGEDISMMPGDAQHRHLERRVEELERSRLEAHDPVAALEARTLRRQEELDTRLQMYFGMLQTQQFLLEQHRQLCRTLKEDIQQVAADVRAIRRGMG